MSNAIGGMSKSKSSVALGTLALLTP